MEISSHALATLLIHQRSQLAEAWMDLILQIPDSHYQSIQRAEIRASCFRGIDALLEYQEKNSEVGIEEYVRLISMNRLEQGFEIHEVIQALLLLHKAILVVNSQDHVCYPAQALQIYQDLEDSLRVMVSMFGSMYASAMNKSIDEQQQQAQSLAHENAVLYQVTQQRLVESVSLQRVTSALLQGRTLDEVLAVVCTEAKSLIKAGGSIVFLLEDDGLLHVAHSLGDGEPSFKAMPVEASFTGTVITTGKAVFTNQPSKEELWYGSTLDDLQGGAIRSLLAAPLMIRASIIGALVVVNKENPFDPDDLRVMGLFADQAAIAIENGRLIQEVEQIAVMEERNRLARDLHDSVTQSLYGVSLYAEAAARRLDSEDYPGVAEYLRELRKTALDALKEMRLLIFELRPPLLDKEGLEAALQARLDAVEGRAGLKTELRVDIEGRLPAKIEEGLYRIAQEALNNVLKHALAHHVMVCLEAHHGMATLNVSDDGVGFSVDRAKESGGVGIKGMYERVQSIGGALEITSRPGEGTNIKVQVKL